MPDNGPWITKTIIELEERVAELECMVERSRYAAEAKFDCTSLTPSISEGLSGEV